MVGLTQEMKAVFAATEVFSLATATGNGVPNVAPMKSVWLEDDSTIWIGDNFMRKTLANLKENPKAALFLWSAAIKGCYQVKADVELLTSGPDYEEMRARVHEKRPAYAAKTLLVLHVTDVFSCLPGEDAGAKLI